MHFIWFLCSPVMFCCETFEGLDVQHSPQQCWSTGWSAFLSSVTLSFLKFSHTHMLCKVTPHTHLETHLQGIFKLEIGADGSCWYCTNTVQDVYIRSCLMIWKDCRWLADSLRVCPTNKACSINYLYGQVYFNLWHTLHRTQECKYAEGKMCSTNTYKPHPTRTCQNQFLCNIR